MGLFDTVECDDPLPDPRHQGLEFQTKDLDCWMERYTITRDGRLIKHPRSGLLGAERPTIEKDVELPIHGDLRIYDQDPDAETRLIEYVVRFTHGRVEWIRRLEEPGAPGADEHRTETVPRGSVTALVPEVMGRRLTVEEFAACTPEKLELVGGRMPGEKKLLLLLLTSIGVRRAAALVGYELWRRALPDETDSGPSLRR